MGRVCWPAGVVPGDARAGEPLAASCRAAGVQLLNSVEILRPVPCRPIKMYMVIITAQLVFGSWKMYAYGSFLTRHGVG